MTYTYRPRVWWDTSNLPRLGFAVSRAQRTELIIHHTVGNDPDGTPLIWETDDEIQKHMRFLQTVRQAELGADIPYNFVAFIRPDWSITVCEGRGFDRTGAHTKYRNTSGVATSFAGDFHNQTIANPDALVASINEWLRREKMECPNVGPTIFGHRDFTGPTSAYPDVGWTACPGNNLYALKPRWTWASVIEEDDVALTPQEKLDIAAAGELARWMNQEFEIVTQPDGKKTKVRRIDTLIWTMVALFDVSSFDSDHDLRRLMRIARESQWNKEMLFGNADKDIAPDADPNDNRRLIRISREVQK